MVRLMTILMVLVLACLSVACGAVEGNPNGSPKASDFDQSCQMDSDCIVVRLSSACGCSESGAVNKGAQAKVDAANKEEQSYSDTCTVMPGCVECNTHEAKCEDNTCTLVAKPIEANKEVCAQ